MTGRSSAVFLWLVLSGSLVLTGCSSGKKSFTLKGSVSYQGKALTSGIVRLHMADERMAMAIIQPDGSFEATDVFPGEAKVTIERRSSRRAWRQAEAPKTSTAGKSAAAPSSSIPTKYRDVDTSGLVFTLVPEQPLEIKLE